MNRRFFVMTAVATAVAASMRLEASTDGSTFREAGEFTGFGMDASCPPSPIFRVTYRTIQEHGPVCHENGRVRCADIFDFLAAEYKDRAPRLPALASREGWLSHVQFNGWDTIHREHDATLDLYWVQFSRTRT